MNTSGSRAGGRRRFPGLCLWVALALAPSLLLAEDFDLRVPASATDASVPALMRDLAVRALPVYHDADRERYLANLSALQLAAGDYAAADASRQSLRDRRRSADAGRPIDRTLVYDLYAHAKALESSRQIPFDQSLAPAFKDIVSNLSDHDAYSLGGYLQTPLPAPKEALQQAFDQNRSRTSVSLEQALDLVWAYVAVEAHRSLDPLIGPLLAAEESRRYISEPKLLIRTASGAQLQAMLVRPRSDAARLPTLLEFTDEVAADNAARECAAHGYVGVVAYVRGVPGDPQKIVPLQPDGADAVAVIEWIAQQPWSDGRVAMYGSGYSGFTAWAAAKRAPHALKAIAAWTPMAPGIDAPMDGNIFHNSALRWVSELTHPPAQGLEAQEEKRWQAVNENWYRSGAPYRQLDKISGAYNRFFRRWLDHPSFDRFWQRLIPFGEQFARIDIPVLTMTGYYDPGSAGALYYFTQHQKYDPQANHTLLVGPYDDSALERGPQPLLQGYSLDAVAAVDLRELRYQWFDHVLKNAPNPALLEGRVNYEVMGTNRWEQAASIEAMGPAASKYFLAKGGSAEAQHLSAQESPKASFVLQSVSLTERSDAAWRPASQLLRRSLEPRNAVAFVSDPLPAGTELSGTLSGRLDFRINRMDVDLYVSLFEQLPSGDYLPLFAPPYAFRASYARDRVHRHLLKAGERQQLTFQGERLMSRSLQEGSRLVLVLGVNKRPDQQINYGAGDDVSIESIDNAEPPLSIRWYSDSYVEVAARH
jgi:putative CocE/NonD family hydrolase